MLSIHAFVLYILRIEFVVLKDIIIHEKTKFYKNINLVIGDKIAVTINSKEFLSYKSSAIENFRFAFFEYQSSDTTEMNYMKSFFPPHVTVFK